MCARVRVLPQHSLRHRHKHVLVMPTLLSRVQVPGNWLQAATAAHTARQALLSQGPRGRACQAQDHPRHTHQAHCPPHTHRSSGLLQGAQRQRCHAPE